MNIQQGQYYAKLNDKIFYIDSVYKTSVQNIVNVEYKYFSQSEGEVITDTNTLNGLKNLLKDHDLYELEEGDIWKDNDGNQIRIVETFDDFVDWEDINDEMFQNKKDYLLKFILENGFFLAKNGARQNNYDFKEGQYYVTEYGGLFYIESVNDVGAGGYKIISYKYYDEVKNEVVNTSNASPFLETLLKASNAKLYKFKSGDIWEDPVKSKIEIVKESNGLIDYTMDDSDYVAQGVDPKNILEYIIKYNYKLTKKDSKIFNYVFDKGYIFVDGEKYIKYIENVSSDKPPKITYVAYDKNANQPKRNTKDIATLEAIAYQEQWRKYEPKVGDVWSNNEMEKYAITNVYDEYIIVDYTNYENITKSATYSFSQFFELILPLENGRLEMKVKEDAKIKESESMYESLLEKSKKELSQLLLMRSFLSPINFEKKLQINQQIDKVQKEINDYNFKIIEYNLSKDDIIEDLFEQSFTPINNLYSNVYAKTSKDESDRVTTNFFTPDGSPSKLSDSLNMLIRTPEFIDWFGNWQLSYAYRDEEAFEIPCSKVISKEYEPLVVWHGTGTEFSYFKFDNFPAAYFAVNWKYSKWFADMQGGGNGFIIPFFLNVRNPLDLTTFGTRVIKSKQFFDYIYLKTGMTMDDLEVNPIFFDTNTPPFETWVYLRNNPKMLKKIADLKIYDGIHFYETNPSVAKGEAAHSTEVFITFEPNQAKIADPERGNMLFASMKSFLLKKGGKI